MTRSPCSEVRVNKMDDSKRKTAKGVKEVKIKFAGEKAKGGESLQEAFKRFRKERQVSIPLHIYALVILILYKRFAQNM